MNTTSPCHSSAVRFGWLAGSPRHPDPLSVEGEVGLAVVEVVFEAAADEEAAVGRHGDVAGVEEASSGSSISWTRW